MGHTKYHKLKHTGVPRTNAVKGKGKQKKDETFKEKATRNWLDLPSDIMINILQRVSVIGILRSVQKVCTNWRQICKEPCMWRVIHLDNKNYAEYEPNNRWPIVKVYPYFVLQEICRNVVDRSQGQLVDISIKSFCDNELLKYVAERSSNLRRLKIESSKHVINHLPEALKKFPLLEELSLNRIQIPEGAIQTLGRDCHMLKKLILSWCMLADTGLLGLAIAENLPALRHLRLKRCKLTDSGLRAILDSCCHLQVLELNECYPIDLTGELEKRCLQQIKCVKFTDRSRTEDHADVILSIYIKSTYVYD